MAGGDNVRRTRAAAKRSAMEEDATKSAAQAKKRAVKKRPALVNLSNQQVASSRAAGNVGVPVKEQQQHGGKVAAKAVVVVEGDENAVPVERIVSVSDLQQQQQRKPVVLQQASAAAIASLERRTVQNLYISKDEETDLEPEEDDSSSTESSGWSNKLSFQDIDHGQSDPQMCSMYAAEIYEHLRRAEIKRRPSSDFMESLQQDINKSMRGILIDWLVEVAEEYKLVPDTLYYTISYIDRFLSSNVVPRQRLQLLGVSCMLIAAKYEEICSPQVEEFCYITDNTYCREEVLEMERKVLNELNFELTTPTTKSFLRRFIRAAQAGYKAPSLSLEFLGNFLAELTLMEYSFLPYLPSLIAASAVFMAKLTLDSSRHPWDSTLQHYTGYKPSELRECVVGIHEIQCNTKNCTLPAIREKYRQHKFKCVSTLVPPSIIPSEYFCNIE
ncbi:hypothetical protein CY35_12G054000 [Sphagnum magellanicum]|nr:hypothetical protein CY35_12G054000 [Sphagnum magellanicum]